MTIVYNRVAVTVTERQRGRSRDSDRDSDRETVEADCGSDREQYW